MNAPAFQVPQGHAWSLGELVERQDEKVQPCIGTATRHGFARGC